MEDSDEENDSDAARDVLRAENPALDQPRELAKQGTSTRFDEFKRQRTKRKSREHEQEVAKVEAEKDTLMTKMDSMRSEFHNIVKNTNCVNLMNLTRKRTAP